MNILIWILFLASGLLYAMAFFNALIPFLSKRAYQESSYYNITLGAFALQSLGLGLVVYKMQTLPLSSVFELFIVIAWFVVCIDLFFAKILRVKLVTFFASLLAAILILLPLMCPYFNINVEGQIKRPLTLVHIIFAGVSYAMMGLGFVLALIKILQISGLQRKKNTFFYRILPPLSTTRKYLISVEYLALFSMLLSIVLGIFAYFVYDLSFSALWLKFLCAIIVFCLQLGFLFVAKKNLLRGKAFAYLAIILFVLSMLLMFPIDYK